MTSPYVPAELTHQEGDCLIWDGPVRISGQPCWKSKSPARLLFERHHGRPPLIRNLVSLCGVRLCIAPRHHADNVADVIAGRLQRVGGGCIEWTGTRVKGYGWFKLNGQYIRPHRWVWEQAHGPIPYGLVVDHICNNPSCCNVEHLRCVTQGDNGRAPHSNSPAGVNLRKTHCKNGHPFDEQNTYTRPGTTTRSCKACRKIWPSQTPAAQRATKERREARQQPR
jgi:hypothetical protein